MSFPSDLDIARSVTPRVITDHGQNGFVEYFHRVLTNFFTQHLVVERAKNVVRLPAPMVARRA